MSKIKLNLDVAKLECVSCKNLLKTAPVFVKFTGESICESCNSSDINPSFIRNKLYEEMMKAALFPCQYAANGCTAKLQFNNLSTHSHESVCIYKHCMCPVDSCKWLGKVEDLFTHVFRLHQIPLMVGQKFNFPKNGAVMKVYQVKVQKFLICVNARKQAIQIEITNLFEGPSVEYKVSLCKPDASDDGEIRKKKHTRTLNSTVRSMIEYDKRLITEMLGASEMLECSVFLVVKGNDNKVSV